MWTLSAYLTNKLKFSTLVVCLVSYIFEFSRKDTKKKINKKSKFANRKLILNLVSDVESKTYIPWSACFTMKYRQHAAITKCSTGNLWNQIIYMPVSQTNCTPNLCMSMRHNILRSPQNLQQYCASSRSLHSTKFYCYTTWQTVIYI